MFLFTPEGRLVLTALVWASWAATVGQLEFLGLWCLRGRLILAPLVPGFPDGGGVTVEVGSVGPRTLFISRVGGFLLVSRFSCRPHAFAYSWPSSP